MTERKSLQYYLNLIYPFKVYPDPEGGYVANIEELPGCVTQAETPEELFIAINNARRGWIEVAYEDGQTIPEPKKD
ncbi:hypothetical protein LCGC14_1791010 [marine sediment metagenome]|uniref:HicB-like antitoxin of toxin-antitoxin system domain-containing protein n=1 Tax=marine sediment metagenome TaxID=412755 RepID=A0A0F9HF70_9ZZZZ